MPFGMSDYVQSVVVEGTVYVGGGYAGKDKDSNYIVMTYDIFTRKWATLPPYRACYFAMTAISNQLVLVGGSEHGDRTKVLGMWNADDKQWTHPYLDMHTERANCSAVVYREWLVVAGGVSTSGDALSSVEVMNTDTKQWHAGPPTPTPWSYMRTAVVGDTCYFMGGVILGVSTNKVYTVSLSALTSGLLTSGLSSKEPRKDKSPMWSEISGMQFIYSTPLSISGSLLAVGGRDENYETINAIHFYQPDTGKWVKVGDLPTPRRDCTCTMITDKEMLVAGGGDGINYPDVLKNTDIALLK